MSRVRKIDLTELAALLDQGRGNTECAKVFGVSPAAITQAKRRLGRAVVKDVTLEKAHLFVERNLDAVEQLRKINENANELLDLCMRWQRGDDVALRILETQVKKVLVGKGEDAEVVKEYKFKDPRELALKAMAEIRSQLKLQLEIFQSLYTMQAVKEFQQEVLAAIGAASPDVRDAIIHELTQKHAVRKLTQFDQP